VACIFCAIAAGEVPSASLYEDGRVAAFLDVQPLAPGHALVVPKKHAARLEEASPEDRRAIMDAVAVLSPLLCKETGAPDSTIAIHNGKAAGQEVPHLHVHIVPRRPGDGGGPIHALFPGRAPAPTEELHDLAVRVQAALAKRR
jgi:histidine triad (HIT) family protein